MFLTKCNITPNRNCVRTQIKDELIFDIEGNELIEEMPSVQSRILNYRIECPENFCPTFN